MSEAPRVALIFDRARPDTIGGYFERACQSLAVAYDHWWLRDAGRMPRTYALYLRIDHGDYTRDLPTGLHPKLFYATDTHLPGPWKGIRRVAPHYDLVCCAHRSGAVRLANGVWVPVGCDPELHARQTRPVRWDVAAVGTEGGLPRKIYLQAIRERYPNSRLLEGPHTEIGAIYSQAKIGFNYSIREDINMRMFEVLCGGAMLLTNALPHDDLAQLGLHDRRHYVAYRNPRDLFACIEYYLAHDAERQVIAEAGRRVILDRHTYAHRLSEILQLVEQRLGVSIPRRCVSSSLTSVHRHGEG